MKRVLVFLLLFGAGLAVLLWLKQSEPDRAKEPDLRPRSGQTGPFTEIPTPTQKEGAPKDVVSVLLDGPIDIIQKDPAFILHANDVDHFDNDELDLKQLRIQIPDPATNRIRAELTSPLSHIRFVRRPDGGLSLPTTEPIAVSDVDLTLNEGGPLAPLRLQTTRLDMKLADRSFSSKERVHVTGRGLSSNGLGLTAGVTTSSFAFERDATIRFDLQGQQTVTLTSGKDGGITAKEIVVDGQPQVDVVVTDRANLKLEGPQATTVPITIDASRIHLLGRRTQSPDQPFELLSADADGRVLAVNRGNTFRSEHAEFVFAPGGKLKHATLDRSVDLSSAGDQFLSDHAEFEFDAKGDLAKSTLTGHPAGDIEVGRFFVEDKPAWKGARGKLSGAGPLVVTAEHGHSIDLSGPAELRVEEARLLLKASRRLTGYDDAKTRSGHMQADGDVALDYGVDKLRSDSVVLDWRNHLGVPTVFVTTTGVTTVDATAPDGRQATTIAGGGLEASASRDQLRITQARGVEIASAEKGGLHATAASVRDLDPEQRTFVAEGGVGFDSAQGRGTADRIEAVSRDETRLFGSRERPAQFDFVRGATGRVPALSGHVEGVEIVVRPERIQAREGVKAHVDGQDAHLDLTAGSLDLRVGAEDPDRPEAPRPFRAEMSGDVDALLTRPDESAHVTAGALVVEGTFTAGERPTFRRSLVHATDSVHVDYQSRAAIVGDGDEFLLDEHDLARLSAQPGSRVTAHGRLPNGDLPFSVQADWIEADGDRFSAQHAQALITPATRADEAARTSQEPSTRGQESTTAILREVCADSMRADRSEIALVGNAHISGETLEGEPWLLDAASVRMRGDFQDAKRLDTKKIASIDADGGFHVVMGEQLEASGQTLHAVPDRVRVEGEPARMTLLDAEWQSSWIQYDTANMLLATDKGSLNSKVGSPGGSWSIEYESMQPFDQGQKTILVLRNPRFRFGPDQLFAEWTLFWVDREEWRRSGQRTLDESVKGRTLRVEEPITTGAQNAAADTGQKGFLQRLPVVTKLVESNPFFRVLSELYIEGNIEIFSEGERTARASAFYLDVVDTQGWIQDADVSLDVNIRGFRQRLRAKAAWMRIAPTPEGPSLRAEDAEITSCDFDHPHYVIQTGDLRITPRKNAKDARVAYGFSTRKNRLRFENGLRIWLPSFAPEFDREGKPLIDRLVLGNSARYGAAIRATLNQELGPVGKATGRAIGKVLNIPEIDLNGNWHYNLGILGSRGVLVGIGIDFDAGDRFRLTTDFDGIPDRRADRGLVRVDEDDRSLIRTWFRARSRYTIREGEWVDVAFSRQSDAGVQSEFFERDYLRYETKDNYVHWRKAKDEWYFDSSLKGRLEDRRDVDELPSVGAYRGRTRIGYLFDNPIYYSGRVDAAYLRRRDGDARYYAPFEDGLGDRNLLRADTEHRVEAPFSLGVLAARGTPYAAVRGTFWSEGADPDAAPSRSALIVGFDATTTFWKRFSGGSVHTISPTIGVHADVVSQESGGDLIVIDKTEDPIEGQFVDFGVRSRWWVPDTAERMDISVRTSHGSKLSGGGQSGLQPIHFLGDYLTYFGDVPVGATHDARYDTTTGNTTYSLSSLGIEPWQNVGVELGYQRGLSTVGQDRLFESASIAARWRWTPKWELEVGQSYAIAEGTGVGNSFTLRRLGHDFVTEIEVDYRSGEGSTFSLNFQPRISWRRSGLGLLDRWLGPYH